MPWCSCDVTALIILMAAVTPLLMHWSYCSLALSNRCGQYISSEVVGNKLKKKQIYQNGSPSETDLKRHMNISCHTQPSIADTSNENRVLYQCKDSLSGNEDFRYKDKTIMILPYLYNRNFFTGKMTSLYWEGHLHIISIGSIYLCVWTICSPNTWFKPTLFSI